MPIQQPVGQSSRPYAAGLLTEAGRLGNMAYSARTNALNTMLAKREAIFQQIDRIRQERQIKKEQAKASGMSGGDIGAMIGAGAAIVAAPFTGGASLALLPALTSVGGGIGTLADGGDTAQGVSMIANGVVANPGWSGPGTPSSPPRTSYGPTPGGQLR